MTPLPKSTSEWMIVLLQLLNNYNVCRAKTFLCL